MSSESTPTLRNSLQELHSTEIAQLSRTGSGGKTRWPWIFGMMNQYIQCLAYTWSNFLRNIMYLGLKPIDLAVAFAFALGCSIVLCIGLLFCIFMKFPLVGKKFDDWSRTKGYGLSITNAWLMWIFGVDICGASNIFRQITREQVDAARSALEQPPVEPKPYGERTFNVDVAKLLLQFSALMYERGAEPVLSALSTMHDRVSLQNGAVPSPAQLPADFAGALPAEAVKKLSHNVTDGAIRDFCRTFRLDYAPVSELNTSDSAYAALFWDPGANWIVVAFKGTSPTEYSEWVSDFNYTLVDAGYCLPDFSKVHGGFLQRIFPDDVSHSGGRRPWDAIIAGISRVAEDLRGSDPDAKINLYFTGHSLGCAIASLAYARAVLVEKDLGQHVILRDGYLFAAPIVCDVKSVKAFNGAMNENHNMPKTLWRVTNKEDIVATGLPAFGDKRDSVFLSNSRLKFAHLGAEIKMRSKPMVCQVAGSHFKRGLPILVTSSLGPDSVGTLGVQKGIPSSALNLEKLPLMGRFFQHATNFYWDQLQRVGVGQCQWIAED